MFAGAPDFSSAMKQAVLLGKIRIVVRTTLLAVERNLGPKSRRKLWHRGEKNGIGGLEGVGLRISSLT